MSAELWYMSEPTYPDGTVGATLQPIRLTACKVPWDAQ